MNAVSHTGIDKERKDFMILLSSSLLECSRIMHKLVETMCSTFQDYACSLCKLCMQYACHLPSYLLHCCYV